MSNQVFSVDKTTLIDEHKKLGFALSVLHSVKNSGDINQLDFDVRYFSYCAEMSKIKRALFQLDKRASYAL